MIGLGNGTAVSITGLGSYVPEQVMTNDDMAKIVDTTDEWIVTRTGIKERRIAAPEQALSDLAEPAARQALERAGVDAADLDLIIVATITPDMVFPSSSALVADRLGATKAGAYDLSAGCTGFMYAVAQAHASLAAGLARNALVIGADMLSRIVDWSDRSTCVLFGDGAGAVVMQRSDAPGFYGFDLGADGSGGKDLCLPGGGSKLPATADSVAAGEHYIKMNGREVFKFATRVLVSSAQELLDACGRTIDEVDLYVPHQANIRIIEHAAGKLGVDHERVMVNADRFGNTSSASIPLALADAQAEGRLRDGSLVLMTGMGAGLTWGSALMTWTGGTNGN